MRLISRQDWLLVLGLIAAAAVLVAEPVERLLEVAREVQEAYGISLLPAVIILLVVFIVHLQNKRQQMTAAATAAAATAKEAEGHAHDLELLVGFGQALARSLDVEAIREVILQALPRLTGSDGVWVLIRSEGRWLALMGGGPSRDGEPEDGHVPYEHLAERALSLESGHRLSAAPPDWEGQACFAMISGGTAVGVLGVPEASPMAESHRRLLVAASALLAVSLKNAQLFDEVRVNSYTDGLTGLINRTHGVDVIEAELQRARRSRTALSLVMFDIDYFKAINDRYGHLCGDAVLTTVARRTRELLRVTDIKCRYGGEEFIVLLPDTGLDGAKRVAETLRRELAATVVSWNTETVNLSASFGVTTALPDEIEPDALIARADAALYCVKGDGRNCVRVGEDPVPVGDMPS